MNSSLQTLSWSLRRIGNLIFSSFSPFSFPSLPFLAPLDVGHKYPLACLETMFCGGSRTTAAGCRRDAPHTLPSSPSSTAEKWASEAAAPHLLLLSFSHPIIIHHQSQETHALLSQKLLSLWKYSGAIFLLIRALKMYNSHKVFSFIINLSTGAHFCTFLHLL